MYHTTLCLTAAVAAASALTLFPLYAIAGHRAWRNQRVTWDSLAATAGLLLGVLLLQVALVGAVAAGGPTAPIGLLLAAEIPILFGLAVLIRKMTRHAIGEWGGRW